MQLMVHKSFYQPFAQLIIYCCNSVIHLRTTTEIGKGEFGTVWRGQWHLPDGQAREIAIKVLNPDLPQKDRIRFLQEAVILGQFRHPNIMDLFGVVKDGEPVSGVCTLEWHATCID